MSSALFFSLFFTVALLVITAYFLMGGLPLLVLTHDTTLDARFIRGFFSIYYRVAFWTSLGASASYAFLGRSGFALAASALAIAIVLFRRRMIPAMEQIGAQIQTSEAKAVRRFRQVHSAALLFNLAQLVVLVWCLIKISV